MANTSVTIHPVILSGGNGTRLWPLSRATYPKQFLPLIGQENLFQATVDRAMSLSGEVLQMEPPLCICNQEHRYLIREQCLATGHTPAAIYLEPAGRNTAPAIALAALHLAENDPNALMLVLPADHLITDQTAFCEAVLSAANAAQEGYLATFGITPVAPETGFGYIRVGASINTIPGVNHVAQFVEKPDRTTAEHYLASREFYWNSGIFLFSARRYLAELGMHRPDILDHATRAWRGRVVDHDFCRPAQADFLACPSESIDYAVMQATTSAAVVQADMGWSDLGSWDSLWTSAEKDTNGNAVQGDVFTSDTRNSYLRSESRLLAVIGLDDVVVVETADAVLVMHKDKAQNIKQAIDHFKSAQRSEHLEHLRVHRPWGWYEAIDQGERFKVKRIMVKPGEALSLQMHHHRAEHWVVVSGTARITLGEDSLLLTENQSTYIPIGQIHRLENPGKVALHLVEVQSGSYLGEDDIVRFEDAYGRLT